MHNAQRSNESMLSELDALKKKKLNATETFLAQMFLVLRDHARSSRKTNEKPLSELTLDDILDLVKGAPDHAAA